MKSILALVIMIQSIVLSGLAQKPAILIDNDPGWKKIGETTANFSSEDESIVVLGDDQFASIKLKVIDAPLNIERLQVFYESGEMREFDLKRKINKGSESRKFELDPDKEVDKVVFTYQTAANDEGAEANVILYGFVPGGANEKETTSRRSDSNLSDDISEAVSKGVAEVKDKRHDTKVGPHGQAIYVEQRPSYYYVDGQGKKVYVTESQLRNKKDK